MKNILFIITINLISMAVIGQSMDTIEVNKNLAATIEFSDNIKEIVYGFNPTKIVEGKKLFLNYDEFRLDNKAIIAANKSNPPLTTISVILEDGSLYYGFITYSDKPSKIYYDFKSENCKGGKHAGNNSLEEEIVKQRLEYLMAQSQEYYSYGTEKNHIEIIVPNIMNDENTTYIKVAINNNSSGKYTLTGIAFMHEEEKSKKIKKSKLSQVESDEIKNKKRIQPIYEIIPDALEIPAYSSKTFGFAIPLYTTSTGRLLISCFEKEGTREITVKIKANDIAKIKVFED